ncbi:MAG: polysaccharide biosynthesis C-terminal domain-containing protein [Isosphaeraceae bacterium]|nr:polysaccharide biosynthesis C-terminal domain-containing protein [Isosphaeraceae bacterium]
MNRSRAAIWNYASALLFTAITLIGLWATKYVLSVLGPERFGASRMLTDWLGYLSLIELGLTGALSPMLARDLARQDRERSIATLTVGLQIFLIFGGLTLVAALAMWLVIGRIIPVDSADILDLRIAWGISLVSLLPTAVAPFRSLADAGQRGYRINLALAMQSLMIFGLSCGFARLGWGISGQALATTLAVMPLVIMLTYEGMRHEKGLLRAALSTRPDWSVGRELISLAVPSFLIGLSGRISVLTDSLVVGNILGTSLAGSLVLTLKLVVMAQGQLQGIGAAAWAGLAQLHAKGEREQFNSRLIELTGLVAMLAVGALGPITAYNSEFMAIWVGTQHDVGPWVVALGAFNALLLGLFSLWFWCFTGTGQVARMVPVTVTAAVINLTSSVIATHAFGVIGPTMGTTISFLSVSLWILPRELSRTFGTSIRGLFRAWLIPVAYGVPFTVALHFLARTHRPWGLIGLGLEMGVAAAIFVGLGGRFLLGPDARAVWSARLSAAIPRFRRNGEPPDE